MDARLLKDLKAGIPLLPSCYDYAVLLRYSRTMTGKSMDELRDKMGLATYAEWAKFLNIA